MSIQKVELNFPDFGLQLDREFTPGVNLIEEENWYWKSTLLYTILSLYTKKFIGQRKMPTGTAKIVMENWDQFLYSKWLWVWKEDEPNPLMKFVLPGEFFTLSPKEQRDTIVKILDIDYANFFKNRVDGWTPTLMKECKASLKENEGKESVILQDIERLKSFVIQYEKNPVVIQDNSREIAAAYSKWIAEQNSGYDKVIQDNAAIATKETSLTSSINSLTYEKNQLIARRNKLRDDHTKVQTETHCPTCSQSFPKEKIEEMVKSISAQGHKLNEEINQIELKIKELQAQYDSLPTKAPVPNRVVQVYDIHQQAKSVWMEVLTTSDEDKARKNEYDVKKRELTLKEDQLRSLGELKLQETIDAIDKANREFTQELETKIQEFGLPEVTLFREMKSGETTEDFAIKFDGKDYDELSNGYRNILHARVAIAFAKKFGLDFILLDEAWTLGKKAFDLIKKEAKGMQIIAARATPFKLK